ARVEPRAPAPGARPFHRERLEAGRVVLHRAANRLEDVVAGEAALARGQAFDRPVERGPRRPQALQQAALLRASLRTAERQQCAVGERAAGREEGVRIRLGAHSGPVALRARALAAVEREQARIERRKPDAARRAEEPLRVQALLAGSLHDDRAVAESQRARQAIFQRRAARRDAGRHDQVDVVLAVAIEQADAGEHDTLAVDAGLGQPELARAGEDLLVVALAPADDGCEERDPIAAEIPANAIEDLAPRLRSDRLLALRAVLHPDLGEQQTQVVRDLRDGGDRRGASAARQALL